MENVLENLKDFYLYNPNYAPISNINPFKPLMIWGDANYKLNKFYKQPEIGLTDSVEDLKKKNNMRHVTGLALAAKTYPKPIAQGIGNIKESLDLALDFIDKPFGKVSNQVADDTKLDLENNLYGINYTVKNPNATPNEIMNYALDIANMREKQNNLYDLLIDNNQ